ncbi:ABC transporter permease [Ureaplasma miroungigenitalium]|uniref:ABC transporter permease n=1 Tax=Ureaplasma miroungigenitalium TaxID=1042321 RepID=UPI0021E96279|nr:ABC transporter permease [Ureaplasma miroungigenitalium]MCV3734086.1 ABC transporter permease [Ureaplasma miroungigenitalium]
MRKFWLLMKNMFKLLFRTKTLMIQLSILMIVSTIVVTTTTITVQRLNKSQKDLRKSSLAHEFLVQPLDEDLLVFNDIPITDNQIAYNKEDIVKLQVFNKARLSQQNYLNLPSPNDFGLYWPRDDNNKIANLKGVVDKNYLDENRIYTAFWFDDNNEDKDELATNYNNLVFDKVNNQTKLVGVQKLQAGKILFKTPSLKDHRKQYDHVFKINTAIVKAGDPYLAFHTLDKSLGFGLRNYITNPMIIKNVDLDYKKIIQQNTYHQFDYNVFNNYDQTWSHIIDFLEQNTVDEEFVKIPLHVDLSKSSDRYFFFAQYLKYKNHSTDNVDVQTFNLINRLKDQYNNEIAIDNTNLKYHDLFVNDLLIPKKMITDSQQFPVLLDIIANAKALLNARIKEEAKIFYEYSEQQYLSNNRELTYLKSQLQVISDELNKHPQDVNLINHERLLKAKINVAQGKHYVYEDWLKESFLSTLNEHDVYYKRHESGVFKDSKSNTNFITLNVDQPTYMNNQIVDNEHRIDNMVQIVDKYKDSLKYDQKYQRIFFEPTGAEFNNFENLFLSYKAFENYLRDTYEKDPTQDQSIPHALRDYRVYITPNVIHKFNLLDFFNVLYQNGDWLTSNEYQKEAEAFSFDVYQQFKAVQPNYFSLHVKPHSFQPDSELQAVYVDQTTQNIFYLPAHFLNDETVFVDLRNKPETTASQLDLLKIIVKGEQGDETHLPLGLNLQKYSIIYQPFTQYHDLDALRQWTNEHPDNFHNLQTTIMHFTQLFYFKNYQVAGDSYLIEATVSKSHDIQIPFNINIFTKSADLAYVSRSYLQALNDAKKPGDWETFLKAQNLPYKKNDDFPPFVEINGQKIPKDYESWLRYVVPDENKIEINNQVFYLVGAADSSEFMFPAVNSDDILIDTKKTAVLFLNQSGFDKLKTYNSSVPILSYYTLKTNTKPYETLKKNQLYESLKQAFNASHKAQIYKRNEALKAFPLYSKRVSFLDRLTHIVLSVAIVLICLILILGMYFVGTSLRNLIKKRQIMFATLLAQGHSKTHIWLSFLPFFILPPLFTTLIAYPVAFFLQPFLMSLFKPYWFISLPTNYVSVGWIFALIGALVAILAIISLITIFKILAKPVAETMKGDPGFKLNKLMMRSHKLLRKFGANAVLRSTYVISNLMRMSILMVISSSFTITATMLASAKNDFAESAVHTNKQRSYEYAVDLFSPTSQGGLYYTSPYALIGAQTPQAPMKPIIQKVLLDAKVTDYTNFLVKLNFVNENNEKVVLSSQIDAHGFIDFPIDQLPDNHVYQFEYANLKNDEQQKIIDKTELETDLQVIDKKSIFKFFAHQHHQYIGVPVAQLNQPVNLVYTTNNNVLKTLKPITNLNDQYVLYDVESLQKQPSIYTLLGAYDETNKVVYDLPDFANNLHRLDYSQNGYYLYHAYHRLPEIYFTNIPESIADQTFTLQLRVKGLPYTKRPITNMIDQNRRVFFDLSVLEYLNEPTINEVYQIDSLVTEHTAVYNKNVGLNQQIATFNNNLYMSNNKELNQWKIDYMSYNRPIHIDIKATELCNSNAQQTCAPNQQDKTYTILGFFNKPGTVMFSYHDLLKQHVSQVKKIYFQDQQINLYLNNLDQIYKQDVNTFPYSTIEYNNAMRIINNIHDPNAPVGYGPLLSNTYFPSPSTQPEIFQNIQFLDSKIITKMALDGNIQVDTGGFKIQFNPWVFAKNFLPNQVSGKAEANAQELLEAAFEIFGYTYDDQHNKIDRYYDVPDFTNPNIVHSHVNLWTVTGKAPKSVNDPDSFFIKKDGVWQFNLRDNVGTQQGAAQFRPEFVRLVIQILTIPKLNPHQYKIGLKTINMEDATQMQAYTYLDGDMQSQNKRVHAKIMGINYLANLDSKTKQLDFYDEQQKNLLNYLQDDRLDQDYYPILINAVVAKKYRLKVGDRFDYKIKNHIQRYANDFNGINQDYEAKFVVKGIIDTHMDEQMFVNQKIANHLIGFYDYKTTHFYEGGIEIDESRFFNGFFTKEKNPLFFYNLASFYSPSGLTPALGNWPINDTNFNDDFHDSAVNYMMLLSWAKTNQIVSDNPSVSYQDFSVLNMKRLALKIRHTFGQQVIVPSFLAVDANLENTILADTIDNTIFKILLNVMLALMPTLFIIIIVIASTLAEESQKSIAMMKVLGKSNFANVNNFMFVYPVVWFLNIALSIPLSYGLLGIYKYAIFNAFNIIITPVIPWWVFVLTFGLVGIILASAWMSTYYKTKNMNLALALAENKE